MGNHDGLCVIKMITWIFSMMASPRTASHIWDGDTLLREKLQGLPKVRPPFLYTSHTTPISKPGCMRSIWEACGNVGSTFGSPWGIPGLLHLFTCTQQVVAILLSSQAGAIPVVEKGEL